MVWTCSSDITDGITVGPGGVLKGNGTIIGDIINNGGIITGGMPEPSAAVLLLMGVPGVLYSRPRRIGTVL